MPFAKNVLKVHRRAGEVGFNLPIGTDKMERVFGALEYRPRGFFWG